MSSSVCRNAIIAELDDEDDDDDNIEEEDDDDDVISLTYTVESSLKNRTKLSFRIARHKCSPKSVGIYYDLIPRSVTLVDEQMKVFRAVRERKCLIIICLQNGSSWLAYDGCVSLSDHCYNVYGVKTKDVEKMSSNDEMTINGDMLNISFDDRTISMSIKTTRPNYVANVFALDPQSIALKSTNGHFYFAVNIRCLFLT